MFYSIERNFQGCCKNLGECGVVYNAMTAQLMNPVNELKGSKSWCDKFLSKKLSLHA